MFKKLIKLGIKKKKKTSFKGVELTQICIWAFKFETTDTRKIKIRKSNRI